MNVAQELPNQAPQPPVTPAGTAQYAVQPPVIANTDPRRKPPGLACSLSVMPGLGQVYLGYYQRGFIHAVVVAGLISLLATGNLGVLTPLAAVFLAFFWLYNIIDAGRRATLYNQVLAGSEQIGLPEDFKMPGLGGSIFGGAALMVVGFVLLLNTRFGMSLEWLEEWWPVLLMAFGAYLLIKAISERSAQGERPSEE